MAGGAPLDLIAVEVRADIDQLERQMTGATRVVDANYQRITQSARDSERAIVVSSSAAGDAIQGTEQRTRLLGQQFSQVGQQIAAGTAPLQALAIQLPDIALAFQSTGAAAGGLASFLGGPWGIALTTAAAVAASFIPKILGIGDAADDARPRVDNMTASLERLRNAAGRATQEQLGYARVDVELKAAEVRNLQNLRARAASNIGTAGGIGKIDENIRNARRDLDDAQRLLRVSELVTKKINDAEANAAKAQGSAVRAAAPRGRVARARSMAPSIDREAQASQKQAEAQNQQYERTKAQLELEQRLANLRGEGTESASLLADVLEARARIEAQFPELAKSTRHEDQQRLQVLLDIQNAIIGEAYQRKAVQKAAEEARQQASEEARQAERDIAAIQRQQEQQIRTLAGIYQDAFRGGTDAIWKDFKEIGLSVVADVLARFTMAKLSGGSFDLGGAITAALGSALPGFASGGSMVLGGRGGTDNNTLALNGRPIARVSAGEHLNIVNPALGRSGGTTIVQQTVHVDARNSVNPDGFARQILAMSGQQAQQAAAQVGARVLKATPGRLASFQRDGT